MRLASAKEVKIIEIGRRPFFVNNVVISCNKDSILLGYEDAFFFELSKKDALTLADALLHEAIK